MLPSSTPAQVPNIFLVFGNVKFKISKIFKYPSPFSTQKLRSFKRLFPLPLNERQTRIFRRSFDSRWGGHRLYVQTHSGRSTAAGSTRVVRRAGK